MQYRIGFNGYKGEQVLCNGVYESVEQAERRIEGIKRELPRYMVEVVGLRVVAVNVPDRYKNHVAGL